MKYRKYREPIQLWAPLIQKSIFDESFRRDYQRAQKEWKYEHKIWLATDVNKVARWNEKIGPSHFWHLLIPSEEYNMIVIHHIDKLGRIFPPIPKYKIIEPSLYKRWLNSKPGQSPLETISIDFPCINEDVVSYNKLKLKPKVNRVLKIIGIDNNTKKVSLLGKEGSPVSIVSPETEGTISSKEDIDKIHSIKIMWPEPFNYLFPTGGGLDLIYHHTLMKDLILKLEDSEKYDEVLRETEGLISSFIGKTETTIDQAWFMPKLASGNIKGLLFDVEHRYKFEFENLNDLLKSEDFFKIRLKKVKINRIYSWLGYFWLEFYQDIIKHTTIKFCENCGKIISGGRKDRKYCSKEENPNCWKSRAALRQKKKYHRDRKSSVA